MNILSDLLNKYKEIEDNHNKKVNLFIQIVGNITGYSLKKTDFVIKNNKVYLKNNKLKSELYMKKILILKELELKSLGDFKDIV